MASGAFNGGTAMVRVVFLRFVLKKPCASVACIYTCIKILHLLYVYKIELHHYACPRASCAEREMESPRGHHEVV